MSLGVLVVEDDPELNKFFCDSLSALTAGKIVGSGALSYATAEAMLKSWRPDAVLLDLNLPDAKGFELVKRFQHFYPEIAVVALTGLDEPGLGIQVIHYGAHEFLRKPVKVVEVIRALVLAIERHKSWKFDVAKAALDSLNRVEDKLIQLEKLVYGA